MDLENQPAHRRLTIGELAGLAGVSTRSVRHYHAVGLLPEPEREASGYRRYGVTELVALVRIVRLRAVGMPIARIAAQLADPGTGGGELRRLADELHDEIARLSALHDRLLAMSEEAGPGPADVVAGALREAGRLAPGNPLMPREAAAAELVDALDPAGVAGIVETMAPLLADPARADRLAGLLRQVQQLPGDADDGQLDRLARELLGVLPKPDRPAPPVDLATLEKLLGHRLTDVQRRFQLTMRAAAEQAR